MSNFQRRSGLGWGEITDALGRRIERNDVAAGKKTRYYYNDKWQVACQYDVKGGAESFGRCLVYGNCFDEALLMKTPSQTYYYCHDQLYGPVVLVKSDGGIAERYEYDACGSFRIEVPDDFSSPAKLAHMFS